MPSLLGFALAVKLLIRTEAGTPPIAGASSIKPAACRSVPAGVVEPALEGAECCDGPERAAWDFSGTGCTAEARDKSDMDCKDWKKPYAGGEWGCCISGRRVQACLCSLPVANCDEVAENEQKGAHVYKKADKYLIRDFRCNPYSYVPEFSVSKGTCCVHGALALWFKAGDGSDKCTSKEMRRYNYYCDMNSVSFPWWAGSWAPEICCISVWRRPVAACKAEELRRAGLGTSGRAKENAKEESRSFWPVSMYIPDRLQEKQPNRGDQGVLVA